MKIEDVRKCSFQNWYNTFKNVTCKSIILPLPEDFIAYILKDGIVLPENSGVEYIALTNDSDTESDNAEEQNWDEDDEKELPETPQFSEFDDNIRDAIETLGGKVFPKLNWSSPRDASWILFNNKCCCSTVSDIYLLLKSSDFIVHDLTQRYIYCDDFNLDKSTKLDSKDEKEAFYLVLRRWMEIEPSGEYRCFVKSGTLIGISQREPSLYFDHIIHYKDAIVNDIVDFFQKHIHSKFSCDSYVFDVYRRKPEHVRLIDFNPFGVVTDSLLFTWEELKNGSVEPNYKNLPEFRYVEDNRGVQPSTLSKCAVPLDIVDITSGEDSHKFVDLIKLKIEDHENTKSDDEDEKWKV